MVRFHLGSEAQKVLLTNALAVANRIPVLPTNGANPAVEETAWKNCWNWFVPSTRMREVEPD